jgi:hypothetical protein
VLLFLMNLRISGSIKVMMVVSVIAFVAFGSA